MSLRVVLSLSFALVACDGVSDGIGDHSKRPPDSPPKPVAKPKPATTVVQAPSWPDRPDQRVLGQLSPSSRDEVAKSPVPVLVLGDARLLADAVVTTGPHWYALSSRSGGITVSIHGTRLAHEYRDIPPAKGPARVRAQSAFVTQNEGIWSVSWPENGVAYDLDVECESRSDERCKGERFVMGLAEDLHFVGGKREEGSP